MQGLRSLDSSVQSHVAFVNSTDRHINVYWIDREGKKQLQFIMGPKTTRAVNTYLTHPWCFSDCFTGEIMQVKHHNYFLPKSYTIRDPQNPNRRIQFRSKIIIHFPVYTLRMACLNRVASLIKGTKNIDRDIELLEIPRILQMELKILTRNQRKNWPLRDEIANRQ